MGSWWVRKAPSPGVGVIIPPVAEASVCLAYHVGLYWSWLQRSARKNPAHAGSTAGGEKLGEGMGSRTSVRDVRE